MVDPRIIIMGPTKETILREDSSPRVTVVPELQGKDWLLGQKLDPVYVLEYSGVFSGGPVPEENSPPRTTADGVLQGKEQLPKGVPNCAYVPDWLPLSLRKVRYQRQIHHRN